MRKFIFLIFMAGMFQAQAQAQTQTFDRWEGNRAFERQQMQNDMALRERFDDMRRMQDRLDRDTQERSYYLREY